MGIKSLLSRADFAEHTILAQDGEIDSLHQIMESYLYLVDGYSRKYYLRQVVDKEELKSAIRIGIADGVVRGLDGRIPRTELYDHLGPYISSRIMFQIQIFFEQCHFIRVPWSSFRRHGEGIRPNVMYTEDLSAEDGSAEELVSTPVEKECHYSEEEILELLQLSAREQEVLTSLLTGMNQEEIAKHLDITPQYVSMLMHRIRQRAEERGLDRGYCGRRSHLQGEYPMQESVCSDGEVGDRTDTMGSGPIAGGDRDHVEESPED